MPHRRPSELERFEIRRSDDDEKGRIERSELNDAVKRKEQDPLGRTLAGTSWMLEKKERPLSRLNSTCRNIKGCLSQAMRLNACTV